jgi:dienelactone hydrolase
MTLDSREYRDARVAACRPSLAWQYNTLPFGEWQTELRADLAIVLGGLEEWERPPLDPKVSDLVHLDGFRRETVTFTSRPGLTAFGYYLVPDGCPPRQPAILCLPGHGRGVDSIVGIVPDGSQRPLGKPGEYQADFALQCVANGYPVFALEQISFGHRKDAEARAADAGHERDPDWYFGSSCGRDSMAALMLGESVIGWRAWDAIRALDYLATRQEADPARLVTMGISGGGLTSLFAAALDTRVAACVVSGYLNTFAASVLAVNHCVDNYAPGLIALAEMPDIAGLIAPRLLFAESGRDDPIFPLPTFEQASKQVGAIFAASGMPENFGTEVFDADHRFHGVGAFRFLRERLPV